MPNDDEGAFRSPQPSTAPDLAQAIGGWRPSPRMAAYQAEMMRQRSRSIERQQTIMPVIGAVVAVIGAVVAVIGLVLLIFVSPFAWSAVIFGLLAVLFGGMLIFGTVTQRRSVKLRQGVL